MSASEIFLESAEIERIVKLLMYLWEIFIEGS